ncbi:MAG: flagellar type III secretion system protein FlhB [Rhodocyclaceae bacterium]|nr:flagellar type III secretion system protein FlhB [Rhodocyclaceae bacterium]
MAEDSDLERTESASSRRLEQAREEGQVPRSRELAAFLVLVAGASALWGMSGWVADHATGIMRSGLTFGRDAAFSSNAMATSALSLGWKALLLMAPVFGLTVLATLVAPAVMGGWIFSPKPLSFNFQRLDPLEGVKRMVSVQGLGELVKAILKSVLVGAVLYWLVARHGTDLFAMLEQSVDTGIRSFFHLLFFAVMALLAGVALITAIDVPFQLWRYYAGLRMTKEEVRQEYKEQEGDPQLKARIRSQQRETARKRMMADVPKADVVVTNPTHFAVALKYDSGKMGAPQVVAKGMNLVALKIRELAAEHGVPVLESPPLARALHRHAEIGEQIPAALYTAVAEVMAYIYQLNQFIADGGRSLLPPPTPPVAVAVPEGMDPGAIDA